MSKEYIISVMSRDRVGIVADVSACLSALGGNLEDLSQTVIRGYFTMILLAVFEEPAEREAIRRALLAVDGLAGAEIGVCAYVPEKPEPAQGGADELYMLTAVGQDRIGLVAAITAYLRERDINIVDLATTLNQGEYTMILLLQIPAAVDISKLKHSLKVNLEPLQMSVEIRHHALFRKTNEI